MTFPHKLVTIQVGEADGEADFFAGAGGGVGMGHFLIQTLQGETSVLVRLAAAALETNLQQSSTFNSTG